MNNQNNTPFHSLQCIQQQDALDELQMYRKLYLNKTTLPAGCSPTVCCHINKSDLDNMLRENEGVDGIRCYFGLRQDDSVENQLVTTLVLVATKRDEDGNLRDLCYPYDPEGRMYEFTTPCPNTCDIASVLYTLEPVPGK